MSGSVMPWDGLACFRKACLLVGAGIGLAGAGLALWTTGAGAATGLTGVRWDCAGDAAFLAAAGSDGMGLEASGPLGVVVADAVCGFLRI